MIDQVEDGPKAWQVVIRQSSGVQPESATRIVDSDASRPFVRLQTEGVQVAGVGRIADEKRSNLSMATRRNDVEKPIPILMYKEFQELVRNFVGCRHKSRESSLKRSGYSGQYNTLHELMEDDY